MLHQRLFKAARPGWRVVDVRADRWRALPSLRSQQQFLLDLLSPQNKSTRGKGKEPQAAGHA